MSERASNLISVRAYRKARGISDTTFWREKQRGLWAPVNICGRLYLTTDQIARFERRAASGEFARSNPGAFVASND